MAEQNRVLAGVAAAALAVAVHVSGGLRALEREFSPGLAAKSFDVFGVSPFPEAFNAARAALQEQAKGNSGEQALARAVCSLLVSGVNGSPTQQMWVANINAQLTAGGITPDSQLEPLVGSMASRLAAVQDYPALYRDACLAKY
jgi:hypothetical protein